MIGSSHGLTCTLVALALLIGRGSATATEPVPVALRLVAGTGPGTALDADGLRQVEQTAEALLATSGIKVEWRACPSADACQMAVLVHLLPLWKMADRKVCGEVVHDARTDVPIVLVYLNRNREVLHKMRSGSDGRAHPAVATLDVGHLVGLTIAHELGHALGLPHAATGVMKANPSVDDVIALRRSRLGFSPLEGARMRLAATTLAKTLGSGPGIGRLQAAAAAVVQRPDGGDSTGDRPEVLVQPGEHFTDLFDDLVVTNRSADQRGSSAALLYQLGRVP